jgi:hypothetical protein
MTQEPFQQTNTSQQALTQTLQTLSAREQIGMLVHATRSLSNRDRAVVFRTAGFSVLRDRFLPILLHVIIKRVLAGALWWILCSVAAIVVLLLLVVIEQINAKADWPVAVALASFLVGFLLFALIDFCSSIIQFCKTTRSRAERKQLLETLNASNDADKIPALKTMSLALAKNIPGESLLTSFLTSALLLTAAALLIVIIVGLSFLLPTLGSLPWILIVAVLTFLLGFLVPRQIHHWLQARGIA